MAEKMPQTLANHARLDPLFHFIVLPVFVLAAIGGTIHFLWHPSFHSASFFAISVSGFNRDIQDSPLRPQSAEIASFVWKSGCG